MNKRAVIIIPITGADTLSKAVESALNQTYPTKVLVVIDGSNYFDKAYQLLTPFIDYKLLEIVALPSNVGANGFYGHRVYAAFSHLVNEDYVLFLDQDNWLDPNHVESLVNTIESSDLQWAYSLRTIYDNDGNYVCTDDCESLGKYRPLLEYNHIDTSCYCLRRETAIAVSGAWHGGWGQDRVYYKTLEKYFPKYDCSGEYTLNYRLGGNEDSVKKGFFEYHNSMIDQYNISKVWRK